VLQEKSFESIPGELYNQYRRDVAEQSSESFLFYEISLMEEKPWPLFRDKVYPLFARYIKSKRVNPFTATGVVVAIFHGDRCYLLQGEEFLEVYRTVEGVTTEAFMQKVQEWLAV
jgi:hypothetical protein